MKTVFFSPLTVEECRQRLKTNVIYRRPAFFSPDRYFGRIGQQKIDIGYQSPFFSNSFAPIFYGELQPEAGLGSRLTGSFQIHWFVKIFMTFWLSSAFSWTLIPVIEALKNCYLSGEQFDPQSLQIMLRAGLFPLAGIGLLFLGKVFGKINEKNIIQFLTSMLQINHTEQIDKTSFSELDWVCIGIAGIVILIAMLTGLTGDTLY